jgi:AcrR family transcriptional regulator
LDRRSQILDAALTSFSERGYDATTVHDIRVRSGASIGSIYHHFGGKEQIAAALYVEALRDYQTGFLELLGDWPAERTIKGVVRHHVRWVEANPQLAALLLLAPRSPEMRLASEAGIRELNRAAFEALQTWRAAHKDELQPLSFDAFYAVVIGPAQEAARHRLAGRAQTPLRRLERELADSAWRAVNRR